MDDLFTYGARSTDPETSWIAALRDPSQALQLALQANERSEHPNITFMQTLAESYFQLGDAENAVKWQKAALNLFPPDDPERAECETRLAEYERR